MRETNNVYNLNGVPIRFGWKKSPLDMRDKILTTYIRNRYRGSLGESPTPLIERQWPFGDPSLNQNTTGHCVGFTGADFGINEPTHTPYTNDDGHAFYYMCKVLEGEPNNEGGAYLRSMAKVLQNLKTIEAYAFAPDVASIEWWLLNKGPLLAGMLWTEGMMTPDSNNIIHPTGAVLGGHAFLPNGFKYLLEKKHIHFQNSWGDLWGVNGGAYISVEDFEKLLMSAGEVITAVELGDEVAPPPIPPATNVGCASLIKSMFINGNNRTNGHVS